MSNMSLFDAIAQFEKALESGKGLAKKSRIKGEEKERISEIETEKILRKDEARIERLRQSGLPEEAFTGGGMSDLAVIPGSLGSMVGQLAWDAVAVSSPELAFLSLGAIPFGRAIKGANIHGGQAISKRAYTKGAERAMEDPMLKDLPLQYDSPYVKHYKPGIPISKEHKSAWGMYSPEGGNVLDIWAMSSPYAKQMKFKEPFHFKQFSLSELLGKSFKDRMFPKKFFESTIRHEGRHRMQHVERAAQRRFENAMFEAMGHEDKVSSTHGAGYATLIPKSKFAPTVDVKKDLNPIYHKKVDYLRKPLEVEARLEEILSLGSYRAKKQLKSAGYTDKQIDNLVSEYKIAKEKRYPDPNKPRKLSPEEEYLDYAKKEAEKLEKKVVKKAVGGYIPDSKVFSYIANV